MITFLKKFKNFFYSQFIENFYLYLFSNDKKKFIDIEFENILKRQKNIKLEFWWQQVTLTVLKKIKKYGFSNFLRIRLITDTMFVNDENNFSKYLKLINLEKDYEFIKENPFGNPILSKNANFTSINKLHQFFHLKFFDKFSKTNKSDCFVELGGGYGLLCLLTIKYLKPKKYIIYDLEGFIQIQKIYLKSTLSASEFNKVEFCSNIQNLNKKLSKVKKYNFFAFWSFSEMNFELRSLFKNIIKKSNYFLLGYQSKFFDMDNDKYFSNFVKKHKDYFIIKKQHPCYPRNYYLIGRKKIFEKS